ncbi:MAG: ABC-F family ATP-binding cassette domain-containing protein [Phycisphaeraceae bacterium]
MALLSAANLTLSFGDHRILDGVNFTLAYGEHVGLIGRNGCGKSTLMKLAAGLEKHKPDEGHLQTARDAVIGYLTQDPVLDLEKTLREEAAMGFARLFDLHDELERIAHEMGEAEGDELDRLLKRYEQLEHQMHAAGGYSVDHEIDATLHGVGLEDKFFNVKVSELSGGQKGRLSLAKLLLSQPDLLLLDEPTNHLDIAGRQWLEDYLVSYRGAVMLVSHDRWLLDRVASKIYEIERGKMYEYPGNYKQYVAIRDQRRLTQQREYEKQQDKIKREEQFIDRYRAGQRAKQARGRETRLERFKDSELIERPMSSSDMSMRLAPRSRASDIILTADDCTKAYEGKRLFTDFTLTIKRGDRFGIIGPNGAGKSTLVRCLLGEQAMDRGTSRLGASIDIGHFKQTHEHLDLKQTVVEFLRKFVVSETEQEARDLAGAFLFTGLEQDKPLSVLSGGERARAVLASLMAGGHNVLVLDEPTNHLDISSAERLEEAIRTFTAPLESVYSSKDGSKTKGGGTLLLITHDRFLLDDLVNQLIVFDGEGNVRYFQGTYTEYMASLAAQQAKAAPGPVKESPKKAEPARPAPKAQTKPKVGNSALSRMNQPKLEGRIAELGKSLSEIDTSLADPDIYKDGSKVKSLQDRRAAAAAELEPLEEEWLRRTEA